MKPLIFLTVRSFVNGVRRALTTPQRLIGLLVVIAYYMNFVFRAFTRSGSQSAYNFSTGAMVEFRPALVEGVAFGLFAALSFVLLLGSFNPRGGFRPADVDVLFATPLSPKIVLYFRIVRDYLAALLMPLFFALIGGAPMAKGYEHLFRNFPEQGRLAGRLFTVTYFLMALAWVCVGYAVSLFINRSDEASDRNKKVIDRTVFAVGLAVMIYVGLRMKDDYSWETVFSLTQSPFIRIVFFTATAATWILMAPFHGSLVEGLAGFASLISVIAIALRLAMTQVDHMYDQAAAKGFTTVDTRKLQRSGDLYGIAAEQARRGKVKTGRVARWIGRWRLRGGAALLWKELILQTRGAMWQYFLLGPMVMIMVILPVWAGSQGSASRTLEALFLAMLGMSTFILSNTNSTSGFIELLRRVDFQKPLPFSPMKTVLWETMAKAVPTCLLTWLACLVALFLAPKLGLTVVAGMLLVPSLATMLSAISLLVIVLFPDVDDAAQRGFRGLMLLLGSVISALPGLAAMIGMMVVGLPAIVAAIPFVLLNGAVTAGLCAIAGGLYGSFNPSE